MMEYCGDEIFFTASQESNEPMESQVALVDTDFGGLSEALYPRSELGEHALLLGR
jgi:hypothetical protein